MKSAWPLIIIAAILISISILFDINYLNYSSPIAHSNWQSISLQSFKGLKKPSQTLRGNHRFAFIETDRKVEFLDENKIKITTFFHPSRSYVYDEEIRSNALLQHELYHFHIAEWHTRLMRKKISDYKGKITIELISNWESKFLEMENDIQRQYDEESDHSYVLKMQKRWETIIDSNLYELRKYESPIVELKNP